MTMAVMRVKYKSESLKSKQNKEKNYAKLIEIEICC